MIRRDPGQEQEEDIQESGLLTVSEFARRVRWDTTTVRRHIKDGVIEAISLPRGGQRQVYRIRKAVLDELLNGSNS